MSVKAVMFALGGLLLSVGVFGTWVARDMERIKGGTQGEAQAPAEVPGSEQPYSSTPDGAESASAEYPATGYEAQAQEPGSYADQAYPADAYDGQAAAAQEGAYLDGTSSGSYGQQGEAPYAAEPVDAPPSDETAGYADGSGQVP